MDEDERGFEKSAQGSASTRSSRGYRQFYRRNRGSTSVRDRYGAQAAIRKGNRAVVLILAILTLVAVPVAGIFRSWPGVLGALAAMGIMWIVAAVGIGANQLVLRDPVRTTAYVFGAYLVKLVIVLVAVALLRPVPQVDGEVIFLVLVIAILLTTMGEARVVAKTNKLTIGKV